MAYGAGSAGAASILFNSQGTAVYTANYATIMARQLLLDAQARTFFRSHKATLGQMGATGQFTNKAVVDFTDYLNSPIRGRKVQVPQIGNFQGGMQSGVLIGKEEKIRANNVTVTLTRRRHAVGYDRWSQDMAPWEYDSLIRNELYPYLIARHKDERIFRTMWSGHTAIYHSTYASDTSLGAAAIASGGINGADVAKIYKSLRGRNAKPITNFLNGNGQDFPCYALCVDPDQTAQLRQASDFKSAAYVGMPNDAANPFNSAAVTKFNNMYIFEIDNDIQDGGSPLLAKARLRATVATGSGVSILAISDSGSMACPCRYFDTSGRVVIYNAATTKKEVAPVVSHTNYSIRLDRTAANRTSWATGAIVAQVYSKCIGFGAQVIGKVEKGDPEWLSEVNDYGEIVGIGVKLLEGYTKLDDVKDRLPGICVLHAGVDRTYSPWTG